MLVEKIDHNKQFKQFINQVPVILVNDEVLSTMIINEKQIREKIQEIR